VTASARQLLDAALLRALGFREIAEADIDTQTIAKKRGDGVKMIGRKSDINKRRV
jgi:hypothetical protein